MTGITGFRLRRKARANDAAPTARTLPAPLFDKAARNRLIARLKELGNGLSAMSNEAYGDWINSLPRDEFLELIAIGQEVNSQDRDAASKSSFAIARGSRGSAALSHRTPV